jgi:hypothetical protein
MTACDMTILSDVCSEDHIRRLMTEAVMMSDLNHPHIMKLLGVAVEPEMGLPMIVMPYMSNKDLQSYLRRSRIPETEDQVDGRFRHQRSSLFCCFRSLTPSRLLRKLSLHSKSQGAWTTCISTITCTETLQLGTACKFSILYTIIYRLPLSHCMIYARMKLIMRQCAVHILWRNKTSRRPGLSKPLHHSLYCNLSTMRGSAVTTTLPYVYNVIVIHIIITQSNYCVILYVCSIL